MNQTQEEKIREIVEHLDAIKNLIAHDPESTVKTVIKELERRINIGPERNPLSESGIETLKDTIAIIEGRNRISKLQFQVSS